MITFLSITADVGSRGCPWAGTNGKMVKNLSFSHFPAICLKILSLPFFLHLCLLMGDPLTPPLILLTKKLSLSAVAVIAKERMWLQAITTSSSRHLHENSIFDPFVPAHGQPLDPTSAFTDKNIITKFCCNDIYGKKACQNHHRLIIFPYLMPLWGPKWKYGFPHVFAPWLTPPPITSDPNLNFHVPCV